MGGVLNIGEFHYVILTFGRDAGGEGGNEESGNKRKVVGSGITCGYLQH